MTKAPSPTEMSKGQSDITINATKMFDYTAVADRLRTVSWSNYGHQAGVVNLVYGPDLPTPRNSRVIVCIGLHIEIYSGVTIRGVVCINICIIDSDKI